jgi:hypothetical protein
MAKIENTVIILKTPNLSVSYGEVGWKKCKGLPSWQPPGGLAPEATWVSGTKGGATVVPLPSVLVFRSITGSRSVECGQGDECVCLPRPCVRAGQQKQRGSTVGSPGSL